MNYPNAKRQVTRWQQKAEEAKQIQRMQMTQQMMLPDMIGGEEDEVQMPM